LTTRCITTISRDVTGTSASALRDFQAAARAFVELLAQVQDDDWARPGLGVWTLRDLAGHTSRALLTVESYLDPATTTQQPSLADAEGYFAAAAAAGDRTDPAAIAERGRQAGITLGDDPAAAVAAIADRVLAIVDQADDNALVTTPMNTMTLAGYLPTRTFELVVHTLDIAAAAGVRPTDALDRPLASCLALAARLAVAQGRGPEVLLALTGRRPLPAGFSVL
jgi:uncharacterized protein (TIGR03083 family)